jgi:hypothetical protein
MLARWRTKLSNAQKIGTVISHGAVHSIIFVVKGADDFSRFATRVIFSMAFAIDIADEDNPYFKLADKMGWIISNMGNNGITILDIAPWGKCNRCDTQCEGKTNATGC